MTPLFIPPFVLTTAFNPILTGPPAIIDYLAFANNSGSDVTVTAQDAAGKVFLPGVTVKANDIQLIPLPDGGLQFNGFQVKASTASVIYCWIRVKQ